MVKIVLFALICLSSVAKISVAKASSGFYFSTASLSSKEDIQSTTQVKAAEVKYSKNISGLTILNDSIKDNLDYNFTDHPNYYNGYNISKAEYILPVIDGYIGDNPNGMQFKLITDNNVKSSITPKAGETLLASSYQDTVTIYPDGKTHNSANITTKDGTNIGIAFRSTDAYHIDIPNLFDKNITIYTTTYTINPIDYRQKIVTVKQMVASEASSPLFTINNSRSFELSTGYKFQKLYKRFFIAPQIDYSSFGSNSTSLKTSAISAVGKIGLDLLHIGKNPLSIYGFGGFASIFNSSNGSTRKINGVKYGIGTEYFINKHITIFAELFQINLQNNTQSVTYFASDRVRSYIAANSNPETITITNANDPTYNITIHQLGLNNYINPNTIKATATTNMKNISGFKVGVTVYFNNTNDEELYY